MAELRRRNAALQAELATRDAREKELREQLPRGWRSWKWVGQLPALLTAMAAVGALFYTAQGLSQTQSATARQNELALQQNQLAQSGQITDRFNAAVTNMGSDAMTIRLGGIYALQRIMNDSPPDQPAAIQVLTAFIRSQPPAQAAPEAAGTQHLLPEAPAIDVQAAISVVIQRNPQFDGSILIDLQGANLVGADLENANLDQADLVGADLDHADLTWAHLASATLYGANLTGADLIRADLDQAYLNGANLTDTDMRGTGLKGANLLGTQLCQGTEPTRAESGYICSHSSMEAPIRRHPPISGLPN